MKINKVLVTGGSGFIGSAVCRHLVLDLELDVVNIDKLTYAANQYSLGAIAKSSKYAFEKIDICNRKAMTETLAKHMPDAIMHLAAESHVDRSIDGPEEFIETNIIGTYRLLEVAKDYFNNIIDQDRKKNFRFHHVSTDEVFGSLGEKDLFTEETPYAPNSPYSASKAASDHLVRAWFHTYGIPVLLSNCSNNYGLYQFPEKLIPLMIINAVHGLPLPVYGKGLNKRDWLHVEDHARALSAVLLKGVVGEKYNIGGYNEVSNIEVVHNICDVVDKLLPNKEYKRRDLIEFVEDRPGHDWRYAIDSSKITNELGWIPKFNFNEGLYQTVEWYLANEEWWKPIYEGNPFANRIGLSSK